MGGEKEEIVVSQLSPAASYREKSIYFDSLPLSLSAPGPCLTLDCILSAPAMNWAWPRPSLANPLMRAVLAPPPIPKEKHLRDSISRHVLKGTEALLLIPI